ncbi:HD domain-containing protein [Acetivibrio cellulolyticus]|uniref:HD domain-containing protein n=1 Tax=Acetivibrio cellulolyticus TaxID=35830 RepID=UPI0001E2BE20|nr:HD domain-containing protein [Acetivibrio cellulolyticus]
MISIEIALKFAMDKHKGQVDKSGAPYIEHVMRVAEKVKRDEEKIVALLHDVVEDTSTSLEEIESLGVSDEIIKAIDLLTHKKDSNYYDYIRNISKNNLAKVVKLADLEDNTDVRRMEKLPNDLKQRLLKKYELALSILNEGK